MGKREGTGEAGGRREEAGARRLPAKRGCCGQIDPACLPRRPVPTHQSPAQRHETSPPAFRSSCARGARGPATGRRRNPPSPGPLRSLPTRRNFVPSYPAPLRASGLPRDPHPPSSPARRERRNPHRSPRPVPSRPVAKKSTWGGAESANAGEEGPAEEKRRRGHSRDSASRPDRQSSPSRTTATGTAIVTNRVRGAK